MRRLLELAPQQSWELPVRFNRGPESRGKKRKKDYNHRLYRPSRTMADANEFLDKMDLLIERHR
jgi:hypothetical protein